MVLDRTQWNGARPIRSQLDYLEGRHDVTRLLTQNSELRPHNVWNWSIPAWHTRLPDGTLFKTCPSAGICAQVCYARNGTYRFRNVAAKHQQNLLLVLNDREGWKTQLSQEIARLRQKPRDTPGIDPEMFAGNDHFLRNWLIRGGAAVRIHDAGDFFADWYLEDWCEQAKNHNTVLFYAYTKEVAMFRRAEEAGLIPYNFRYLFSTGGTQDAEIGSDRHADVFPDEASMKAAGYTSQEASDLLAILLQTNKIGIKANNIRHFNKKIDGRTFSEMQAGLRTRYPVGGGNDERQA